MNPKNKTSPLHLSRETLRHLNARTGLRTGVAQSGYSNPCGGAPPPPPAASDVCATAACGGGGGGRTAGGCMQHDG